MKNSKKISNGVRQRTIKGPVVIEGIGLQTGSKTRLNFKRAPANSGINFIRVDLPNKPLINIQSISFNDSNLKERRTTLGVGPIEIQTTEHLLAALSGLGIDNVIIEIDGSEMPALDGSAKGFLDILKKAGITEQDPPKKVLKIEEAIWCKDADSVLVALPDEEFKISYVLSYKSPAIGTQTLTLKIYEESFEKEIAPARTFCLEEEALELLKRGLGKGANYDNTLVMGNTGPINNILRFPDEPVRHKILDLIGDLYLVGMPLKGHVIAIKSGHKLNMELVKKLREE